MKAVKTIVATAVIVFALSTVAMAGVQRLGGAGEAANATPAPATAVRAAQQGDSVTLSAQQFTALLKAVAHDRAQDRTRTASHSRAATGTQAQAHTHAQTRSHATTQTHAATQTQQATQTTFHPETHHTVTQSATHDGGGAHSGSHHADTHSGGHDGGCD